MTVKSPKSTLGEFTGDFRRTELKIPRRVVTLTGYSITEKSLQSFEMGLSSNLDHIQAIADCCNAQQKAKYLAGIMAIFTNHTK